MKFLIFGYRSCFTTITLKCKIPWQTLHSHIVFEGFYFSTNFLQPKTSSMSKPQKWKKEFINDDLQPYLGVVQSWSILYARTLKIGLQTGRQTLSMTDVQKP